MKMADDDDDALMSAIEGPYEVMPVNYTGH